MPGLSSYTDVERGHARNGPYSPNGYDPYRRDEFYRDEDPYRREIVRDEALSRSHRNGYGNNTELLERSSLDERIGAMKEELVFEADHLATYTSRSGPMTPEDGLRKLRQMENNTGIWTMRCFMVIDRKHVIIQDKGTGDELDRFPIDMVYEPTAILKNDRREVYNNLVLFSVVDDPRKRGSVDMHIFQSISSPAQEIVDEVLNAKEGRGRVSSTVQRPQPPPPPPPQQSEPSRYSDSKPLNQSQRPMGYRASYIREREDLDTGQNEALERDVQLLNNCFDDIEKFVARLQQAAEAYKELERRKRDHGGRNKKRAIGEGMLTLRSRPPPSEDFIDIFQKFKFAFCVLSKLKAHIHDPNAPELVHFLFTPLSLIYEASRDPVHRGIDLADKAVSPILTLDAKQLLLNCLTSKELELWQALGKNWTISKDEYRGYSPPYTPRFYDGWQPSPMSEERERPEFNTTAMAHAAQIERRALEDKAREHAAERIVPFPPADDNRRAPKEFSAEYSRVHHSRDRLEDYRSPTPPPVVYSSPPVAIYNENKSAYKPSDEPPVMTGSHSDENAFARDLKRMGASVSEVKFERAGRNAKELTVERGEILQVLDSSRNWWKVKNVRGQTGYVPYTILKDLDDDRYDKQDTGERRLSGSYNSYIAENYSTSAPAPPPVPDSSPRRGKRGEFRYF